MKTVGEKKWVRMSIIKTFVILFFLVSLGYAGLVRATTYEPGETLNPDCAPTDIDCGITAPANSGNNSDITGLSALNSVSSTLGLFGNVTSTNISISGALSLPAGSITDAYVVDGLTISGGSINNTSIGLSIPSTAIFTTATATQGLFVSSTLSLKDYGDNHRLVEILTDDSYGDYTITQGSFDNGFGVTRKNQSLRIGFNKDYGGARLNPASASMGLDFESYFMQGANDPAMELHLPSIVDTDGIERRPISVEYHTIAGTSTPGIANLMFNAQGISFGNTTGTQYAQFSPTQFSLIGTGIQQNTNNLNWLRQMNASGDGTVEIARVNNQNQVMIAASGANTVIGNSLGIATNTINALLSLGSSSTPQAGGILFQGDTNLYRDTANGLATDDFFTMYQPDTSGGGLTLAYGSSRAALRLSGGSGDIATFGCTTASCTRMQIGAGGGNQALGSSMDFWSYGHIVFNTVGGGENARFEPNGNFLIATSTDYAKLTVDGNAYLSGTLRIATTTATAGLTVGSNSYFGGDIAFINSSGSQVTSTNIAVAGNYTQTARTNPVIIGNYTSSSLLFGAGSVDVVGNYAYVVAANSNSLQIIDVSNPVSPLRVGGVEDYAIIDSPYKIKVVGKYAYVISQVNRYVKVIDISDASSPRVVGTVASSTGFNGINDLFVSGQYVYVVNNVDDSLRIVDVSNPTNPVIVGGVSHATNLNGAYSVYISGKYAYVANRDDYSVTIIDVSDPTTPVITGRYSDGTNLLFAESIYVSGQYAYVGTDGGRLAVVDVSSSTLPITIGNVPAASGEAVHVSGKYAYLVDYDSDTFQIINIANPTSPAVVATLSSSNFDGATAIDVSGKYAYITSFSSGILNIVDIGGIDAPSAHIGALQSSNISVTENLSVGNNAYINNGLNVGVGGIMSDGSLTAAGTTTLSGLVVSSSLVYMPALAAPGATSDYLCFDTGGKITHQAGNCTVSSQRFKHDIVSWNNGLSTILDLRPVSYKRNHDNIEELGLIAEEVDLVDKHLVIYEPSSTTPRSVDYARLVIPLISAVQSQQQQIDGLLLATAGVNSSTPRTMSEEELLYAANRPLASAMTYLINRLSDGASVIKDFMAERVTAVVGVFERVKTNEMEMTDSITGETYCIRIANGDWEKLPGSCDEQGELTMPEPAVLGETDSGGLDEEINDEPIVEPETEPEEEVAEPAPSFLDQLIDSVQEEITDTEEIPPESSSPPSDTSSSETTP